MLQLIAIEKVEGVERNEPFGIGMSNVNASLADGAQVEAVCVDELHDEDAKKVLITEILWRRTSVSVKR